MTALRASGVGGEYRLFFDIGLFHGLNDEERAAMGREVNAVAAAEATLLLLARAPGSRAPLPRCFLEVHHSGINARGKGTCNLRATLTSSRANSCARVFAAVPPNEMAMRVCARLTVS